MKKPEFESGEWIVCPENDQHPYPRYGYVVRPNAVVLVNRSTNSVGWFFETASVMPEDAVCLKESEAPSEVRFAFWFAMAVNGAATPVNPCLYHQKFRCQDCFYTVRG